MGTLQLRGLSILVAGAALRLAAPGLTAARTWPGRIPAPESPPNAVVSLTATASARSSGPQDPTWSARTRAARMAEVL